MDPSESQAAELVELLKRSANGDSSALSQLLQRYERRVQLAARSLLRAPYRHLLDSLDLVQSVHRAMLPGLRDGRYTFKSDDQLIALAVTVLRHKIFRAAQKKNQSMPMELSDPTAPDQVPDQAVARELLHLVLTELNETDQKIVQMRLDGFDTSEIAESLQCTPAIIRARLSRLRKHLRSLGYEDPL